MLSTRLFQEVCQQVHSQGLQQVLQQEYCDHLCLWGPLDCQAELGCYQVSYCQMNCC